MSFVFGNAQHVGGRPQQQDAFGFSNPADEDFVRHGGLLAVLADGMGGLAHGDMASRTAVSVFLDSYKKKTPEESIPDALMRSLGRANDAVCKLAHRMGAIGELGTTLVAAVLHEGSTHWISVGDSALFLWSNGGFTQLTTSHVYSRELDAKAADGVISEEAARSDPQREALTSHLGIPDLPEVDRSPDPMPLGRNSCLVLASDGLFKTLGAEEMAAGMKGKLQTRCDALVERTLARAESWQDNVTVIALGFEEESESVPRTVILPAGQARPARTGWYVAAALVASLMIAFGVFGFRYCCVAPPAMPASPKSPEVVPPPAIGPVPDVKPSEKTPVKRNGGGK